MGITLDYSKALNFFSEKELEFIQPQVNTCIENLENQTGPGKEFLGWLNLPVDYDKEEFARIKKAAEKIKSNSDIFVTIGVGGSYLGARAAVEFLGHSFYNSLSKEKRNSPEIYFAGNNISGKYMSELLEIIGDRDFSINVISKSGTTLEPAIAFRVLKKKLEDKYGENAKERIFVTTDKVRGTLKPLAEKNSYETFVVPDNVGGRFSVLSAVGLLPIAAAGIDIDELMKGAAAAREEYSKNTDNNCYKYAAIRNILHRKGKDIEMLINYEPRLHYIAEWWKQLFGESEGKDGKGLYPSSADYSTDLHSLGQFVQDGKRIMFETLLEIETPEKDIYLEKDELNLDNLNYLSGTGWDYINKMAAEGTAMAHIDGGVPNLKIKISKADAFNLGYLFYFFEKACAISGYILGVNPFDQPGVEAYKKNMYKLLEK